MTDAPASAVHAPFFSSESNASNLRRILWHRWIAHDGGLKGFARSKWCAAAFFGTMSFRSYDAIQKGGYPLATEVTLAMPPLRLFAIK